MLHPFVRTLSTEQWMIVLSAGCCVCAVPRLSRNTPARSNQSRLRMRSAFLINAVASLLGRKHGAAKCSGCVVGKADGSLLLVSTAAPIASTNRTRRCQSACLRETRPMRINGNFALSMASRAFSTDARGAAGEGGGAKRAGSGIATSSVSDDSCSPASRSIHRASRAEDDHRRAVAPRVEDRHARMHQADIGVQRHGHWFLRDLAVAVSDRDRVLFM